jgi:hypothetical protein
MLIITQQTPSDPSNISLNPMAYIIMKLYSLLNRDTTPTEIKQIEVMESVNNINSASKLINNTQISHNAKQIITNEDLMYTQESNDADMQKNNDTQELNDTDTRELNDADTQELEKMLLDMIKEKMTIHAEEQDKSTIEPQEMEHIIPVDTQEIAAAMPMDTQKTTMSMDTQKIAAQIEEYIIKKIPYAIAQETEPAKDINMGVNIKNKFTPFDKKKPSVELEAKIDIPIMEFVATAKTDSSDIIKDGEWTSKLRLGTKDYNIFGKFNYKNSGKNNNLEAGFTLFKELSIKVTNIDTKLNIDKMNLVAKFDPVELTLNRSDILKKIKLNISKIIELLKTDDVCDTSTSPTIFKLSVTLELGSKQQLIFEIELTSAIKITLKFGILSSKELSSRMTSGLWELIKNLAGSLFKEIKQVEFTLEGEVLKHKIKVSEEQKQEYQSLRF